MLKNIKLNFKKSFKSVRNKLLLFLNRLRGLFRISIEKGVPRLHIHEKYEKTIKRFLRFLLFVSIITSVFSFPLWYINLAFAIFLIILEQLLEKSIFIFSSLFVSAIPEYKPGDWRGMVWGVPVNNKDPFIVGPLFANQEIAHKIFGCIKKWNDNNDADFINNICLSAIIESENIFSMYMYQGFNRPGMKEVHRRLEQENPNKEHAPIVMQIIFNMDFDLQGSRFKYFIKKYKNGDIFIFKPYYLTEQGVEPYENLGFIQKNYLKVKARNKLDKKEDLIEFYHGKFIKDV